MALQISGSATTVRPAPSGRQLSVIVGTIVLSALLAGVVAIRVRDANLRTDRRHRIELDARDSTVLAQLERATLAESGADAGNPLDAVRTVSAALRPGTPISLDELLPDEVMPAVSEIECSDEFTCFLVDADELAERSSERYAKWVSMVELIPVDASAGLRVPDIPRVRNGQVFVGVVGDDAGDLDQVVVFGNDPLFRNSGMIVAD